MGITQGRGDAVAAGFPGPLAVAIPPECEGWEEFFPAHMLFAEDRGAFDESRFWFQDSLHYAEPFYPFYAMLVDYIAVNFNQTSARRFAVPFSLGVEQRILGGYVYLSPNSITEEAIIAGTGSATKRIATGDRIRVDADKGIVTVIDRC